MALSSDFPLTTTTAMKPLDYKKNCMLTGTLPLITLSKQSNRKFIKQFGASCGIFWNYSQTTRAFAVAYINLSFSSAKLVKTSLEEVR